MNTLLVCDLIICLRQLCEYATTPLAVIIWESLIPIFFFQLLLLQYIKLNADESLYE
jgi:hypothetical protein